MRMITFILLILLLCSTASFAELKAFPTAEGYGRLAKGGRGGRVIEVTNLNDSGPGSFRNAVQAEGPRTVVFRVGGMIRLDSRIKVENGNLTVAGQTAPGKGIAIRDATFSVNGVEDVVIRFLRVRLGSEGGKGDGMSSPNSENVIWDHCSISWTHDEAFSAHPTGNITLQRSLISEALNYRRHGFAASVLGYVGSYHHNLLAHNQGRNVSMAGKNVDGNCWGKMDIRNNVVYNWGHRTTDGEIHMVNFVNNYYKPCPASEKFTAITCTFTDWCGGDQLYYISGNVMPGHFGPDEVNKSYSVDGTPRGEFLVSEPVYPSYVSTQTAEEAYEDVLDNVGCNVPMLDDHDKRIIQEVRDGTATYRNGIPNHEDEVGGYEDYPEVTRSADWDSDHDGMPDEWGTEKGLNPSDASDGNGTNLSSIGYTNLEMYLNELAGDFDTERKISVVPNAIRKEIISPNN